MQKLITLVGVIGLLLLTVNLQAQEEPTTMQTSENTDYMPSLITDTPLEGRMLADYHGA